MTTLPTPTTAVWRDKTTHVCRYDFAEYRELMPREWWNSLDDYFNRGGQPLPFLAPALRDENIVRDIRCAVNFDVPEQMSLYWFTELLIEGAPSDAWGSDDKVAAWLDSWAENGLRWLALKNELLEPAQLDLGLDAAPTHYGHD